MTRCCVPLLVAIRETGTGTAGSASAMAAPMAWPAKRTATAAMMVVLKSILMVTVDEVFERLSVDFAKDL